MKNLGATCWLNALIQCLRVCKQWDPSDNSEFYKLVRKDSDDTTEFLKELPFGNVPSDSQEALLYILDKLEDKDFEGEVTQTVVFPGGKSTSKEPCTVWFSSSDLKGGDVLSDYTDDSGKTHNVAIVKRELTRVPKILVSDSSSEELYGKALRAMIVWGMGHYVAFVRREDNTWWLLDDEAEPRQVDKIAITGKRPGLVTFFTDT